MARGWYRVRVRNQGTSTDVRFYGNGVLKATKRVEVLPMCSGSLVIKYLDINGHYRFQPFEKFYQIQDKSTEIGSVETMTTSILTDPSNRTSLGFRTTRTIIANADVDNNQLLLLASVSRSPRVYLRVSASDDRWLLVSIKSSGLVKRGKANSGTYQVTIELPEQFNQTLL